MANRATCYFEAFKRIEETLDLSPSNDRVHDLGENKVCRTENRLALSIRDYVDKEDGL